jgi:hypothetical protein
MINAIRIWKFEHMEGFMDGFPHLTTSSPEAPLCFLLVLGLAGDDRLKLVRYEGGTVGGKNGGDHRRIVVVPKGPITVTFKQMKRVKPLWPPIAQTEQMLKAQEGLFSPGWSYY